MHTSQRRSDVHAHSYSQTILHLTQHCIIGTHDTNIAESLVDGPRLRLTPPQRHPGREKSWNGSCEKERLDAREMQARIRRTCTELPTSQSWNPLDWGSAVYRKRWKTRLINVTEGQKWVSAGGGKWMRGLKRSSILLPRFFWQE